MSQRDSPAVTTDCWHPTVSDESVKILSEALNFTHLAVEIICHVHNVVADRCHQLDRKALEVPIRSRRSHGYLFVRHQSTEELEKLEIICAIISASRGNAGNVLRLYEWKLRLA
jgi:hypothetical protein